MSGLLAAACLLERHSPHSHCCFNLLLHSPTLSPLLLVLPALPALLSCSVPAGAHRSLHPSLCCRYAYVHGGFFYSYNSSALAPNITGDFRAWVQPGRRSLGLLENSLTYVSTQPRRCLLSCSRGERASADSLLERSLCGPSTPRAPFVPQLRSGSCGRRTPRRRCLCRGTA